MIEITPEQRQLYKLYNSTEPSSNLQVALGALRDMTAHAMRLEWEKEHHVSPVLTHANPGGISYKIAHCRLCGTQLELDPRHAYDEARWQAVAHEFLMGGNQNG